LPFVKRSSTPLKNRVEDLFRDGILPLAFYPVWRRIDPKYGNLRLNPYSQKSRSGIVGMTPRAILFNLASKFYLPTRVG